MNRRNLCLPDPIVLRLKNKSRRWLVTGGAGFIGSHLVEHLLQLGQEVVCLDNFFTGSMENLDQVRAAVGDSGWDKLTIYKGDVREKATCLKVCAGVDVVLHQAGVVSVPFSMQNPELTFEINEGGMLNMLAAARDLGISRFVYASSSAVFGDQQIPPAGGAKLIHPASPYGESKARCEAHAMRSWLEDGLPTVGLRYYNVFGPRQALVPFFSAVVPLWIDALLHGREIVVYGNGEATRDFTFVPDIVRANVVAALHDPVADLQGTVVDVGRGEGVALKELLTMIRAALEKVSGGEQQSQITYLSHRDGDIKHSVASLQQLCVSIGLNPRFSIVDGLIETVTWFKERSYNFAVVRGVDSIDPKS